MHTVALQLAKYHHQHHCTSNCLFLEELRATHAIGLDYYQFVLSGKTTISP